MHYLQDTSFHTSDGHCADTTNLVHVLQGKAQGLVAWALGGLDQIQSLQQNGALVPRHVLGALNHVVPVEPRDGHKVDLHKNYQWSIIITKG